MTGAAIAVRDLRKRFAKIEAVRDVSFDVHPGTTTALLGGNGAGKTTTLSMLLGVLLPTAGTIRVLGCDMLRDRYRVLPRMNFTSPYVDLPKRLTVRENLRVFADLYGVERPAFRIGELAAEGHPVLAILFRPPRCADETTPAVLRLGLQTCAGELAVRILKRRGAIASDA